MTDEPHPPIAPRWSDIPEHFYKYRPVAGEKALGWLEQTIERNEVYWAAPIEFNDPFDCAPRFLAPTGKMRKELVRRVAESVAIGRSRAERRNLRRNLRRTSKADMEANFENGVDTVLKESGVYSLSTDPASILMWSHYAESHSGVCLRLRGKPLFEQFLTGHWVGYEDERPKLRIGQETQAALLRKLLFTKARAWQYEAEWRMVQYRGQPGIRRLNAGILDGIILGSRVTEAAEQTVLAAIERSGAKIEVLRAVEDREEYRLTIERA
jgi:hypothetical protein